MTRFKLVLFLLLLSAVSHGQLYINKSMASNTCIIVDPDYGQSEDWIELYNAGNSKVNLNGYFLTDNLNKPDKWKITNITIAPKEFALFWSDSKDSANHTSFNLSATQEQIGLYMSDLTAVDTINYGLQDPNISMGRERPMGTAIGGYLPYPHPGNQTIQPAIQES